MSSTKRLLERLEGERQAKHEALLNLPGKFANTDELHRELQIEFRIELEHSAAKIAELEQQIARGNAWESKIGEYLIGGFVGALMGFALSFLTR
jgi:hypothetical protein